MNDVERHYDCIEHECDCGCEWELELVRDCGMVLLRREQRCPCCGEPVKEDEE